MTCIRLRYVSKTVTGYKSDLTLITFITSVEMDNRIILQLQSIVCWEAMFTEFHMK